MAKILEEKKHHGTNDSQKIPKEYGDILRDFRVSIMKSYLEDGFSPLHVVNMDQTMPL